MKKQRRTCTAPFKAQAAIEALKERQTLSELAAQFEVQPNQISTWKQEFLSRAEQHEDPAALHAEIGQLEMERSFLQGPTPLPANPELSHP